MDSNSQLTEKDLEHWDMLQCVNEAIESVFSKCALHPSLSDPRRELDYGPYLSLFLFGLFNPVVRTMRGLCNITQLKRVQKATGAGPVRAATFSEMQHLLDPDLLRRVFIEVMNKTPGIAKGDARLAHLNLVAQDGSLWSALPRMAWAEYGGGRGGDSKAVRLHLRFHVYDEKPLDARVSTGKECERQALRQMCLEGQTSVGDRYYGEDYSLFGEIDQAGGAFVFRIREEACVHVEQELEISPQDQEAGVVRHGWVRLGAREKKRSMRLRLIEIHKEGKHILLVTNLSVEQACAELIGAIYRRRWSIELFFRWVKCILGCRHFFAESQEGAAIQMYLMLIASLLFQHYTGRRPSKRIMELIQMYLAGWATRKELVQLIEKELTPRKPRKYRR